MRGFALFIQVAFSTNSIMVQTPPPLIAPVIQIQASTQQTFDNSLLLTHIRFVSLDFYTDLPTSGIWSSSSLKLPSYMIIRFVASKKMTMSRWTVVCRIRSRNFNCFPKSTLSYWPVFTRFYGRINKIHNCSKYLIVMKTITSITQNLGADTEDDAEDFLFPYITDKKVFLSCLRCESLLGSIRYHIKLGPKIKW